MDLVKSLHALLAALLASACTPKATIGTEVLGDSPMQIPDTWGRTLGFLDWAENDMTGPEISANAANYSFLWSGIDIHNHHFRSANPQINVGRYMPAFLDGENARPEPHSLRREDDTAERRARTLRWWNTEADGTGHPDWVIYQCDRVTPAYQVEDDRTLPNMPLDFTNPQVMDWLLRDSGVTEDVGFTALSADLLFVVNINHACGIYRNGRWVQLFSGEEADPLFASAVNAWARQLRARLRALTLPRGLVANFPLIDVYSDEQIRTIAEKLDGLVDEQGFTGFAQGRIFASGDQWLRKVENTIEIQNRGTAVYSVNYVSTFPPLPEESEWILGSFLMGRQHAAYLLITLRRGVRWPHLPQYDEDMGHPCAPMRSAENVYLRDFSHGLAVVNPSPVSSYAVTLPPGSFRDLYGARIGESRLVLGPMTGRVLLSSTARCP